MVNEILYAGCQSSEVKNPPPVYTSRLQKSIEDRTALLLEDIPPSSIIEMTQGEFPKSSLDNHITPEENAYMEELQKIIEKIFNLSRIRRETKGKDPLTIHLCREQIKALNDEADRLHKKYGVTFR